MGVSVGVIGYRVVSLQELRFWSLVAIEAESI